MDHNTLRVRLLSLIDPPLSDATTCWVNGSQCPYGLPAGRFDQRPTAFCKIGVCHTLDQIEVDIEQLTGQSLEERVENGIEEAKKEKTVTLSSELKAQADFIEDQRHKGIVMLAADILEEDQNLNTKIIREDDI